MCTLPTKTKHKTYMKLSSLQVSPLRKNKTGNLVPSVAEKGTKAENFMLVDVEELACSYLSTFPPKDLFVWV